MRKEGHEGDFGEHDEIAAHGVPLAQQTEQPFHDISSRLVASHRTLLGGADGEDTGHQSALPSKATQDGPRVFACGWSARLGAWSVGGLNMM
jgi:hypothetical protein